jgi:threonine aldolase
MLGGGMRQVGVVAAAARYAVDHHVERLAEDHARARHFRTALEAGPALGFPLPSPTNIIYVDVPGSAAEFVRLLREDDVHVLPTGPRRVRAVFHLHIDNEKTERAIGAFARAAESLASQPTPC